MNAVGIDVSKGKSMVAIMRPFGEIVSAPFEIKHTASDIHSLVELINSVEGESRIVMEHTGRYYEVLAHQLSKANLFVSAINPKLIKDFDNDSLRKVKSDKADAVKIARYALDKWQNLKQYNVMDELRNQLKTMNRQFGFYMKHKTAMKNNLIGILDQTYPGVNTYFDSPARSDGSQKWVDFASTYWHVDCVRKMSINAFIDHYENWCKRKKYNFSKSKAEEIYGKAKELVPVLPKDDITKLIIKQAVATGWDCPRAQILVKLRDNMDETFEIQTIGRIRRMPEAKHYDNALLDSCYLYTFDEKFTAGVKMALDEGALNACTLFLKNEYKDISLTSQQRTMVTSTRNPQKALQAIAMYAEKEYGVGGNKTENKTRLQAAGYVFSSDIISSYPFG